MLRIHFTSADFVRTHLADSPDPLWETVLSLQMLRAGYGRLVFGPWRRELRAALRDGGLDRLLRHRLFPLTPDAAYFPDFLTPAEGLLGFEAGVDGVLSTPRPRLDAELRRLSLPHGPDTWMKLLAGGRRDALRELGDGLRAYHRVALAPHWDVMKERAAADHARRTKHRRDRGVAGMLAGFGPAMRWRDPVLEIDYPRRMDLYLGGRGLVLVPSTFCWHHPVALADPLLPPTLVYPLRPPPGFLEDHPAPAGEAALSRLLGATRARVLGESVAGATTTELARRLGVSPGTVSQHATVLREGGLLASRRDANCVVHSPTPLGAALLDGRRQPAE